MPEPWPKSDQLADDEAAEDGHEADGVLGSMDEQHKPGDDQTCCLGCGMKVHRIYVLAVAPGHESLENVALCEAHALVIEDHDVDAYDRSPGDSRLKIAHRHLVTNARSQLKQPRMPRVAQELDEPSSTTHRQARTPAPAVPEIIRTAPTDDRGR